MFPSLRGLITPRFRRGRDQTYFLDSIEGFDRRSPSMPRPIWTSIDDHCHPHFRLSAAPSKPSRSHHVAPSSADAPIVFQSRPWHRTPSLSARYPQKLGDARTFDRWPACAPWQGQLVHPPVGAIKIARSTTIISCVIPPEARQRSEFRSKTELCPIVRANWYIDRNR